MSDNNNQIKVIEISQNDKVKSCQIEILESSSNIKREIEIKPKERPKRQLDLANNLFPFCIVWRPLPFLSLFLPFIGHTGICG